MSLSRIKSGHSPLKEKIVQIFFLVATLVGSKQHTLGLQAVTDDGVVQEMYILRRLID